MVKPVTLPEQTLQDISQHLDLAVANRALADQDPIAIVRWALALGGTTIATTSMGVNAAATLYAVAEVDKHIPVVWVDTGFNTADTHRVANILVNRLGFNIHVFRPAHSADAIVREFQGVPTLEEPIAHQRFTHRVKLEPFQRALATLRPTVWISGVRADETDHRAQLDIVTRDPRGILKVAPFYHFSEGQLQRFMDLHGLPTCRHYFDPTKLLPGRECGLHTAS